MAPKVKFDKNVDKVEAADIPPIPDTAKYNALIEAKDIAIAKLKAEIDEINSLRNAKKNSGERDAFIQQKEILAAEIKALAETIARSKKQKQELTDGRKQKENAKKEALQDLKKTESMFQCKDEREVDEAIAKIEWEMQTGTLKLADEKRMVKEIARLVQQKPLITARAAKVAHLKSKTEQMNAESGWQITEQIKQCTEQTRQAWEQIEIVKAKRDALTSEWESKNSGTKELIEKRDALHAEKQEIFKEKVAIREELRAAEALRREYDAEQRRLKRERANAERDAKRAQWEEEQLKRDTEKLSAQPYLAETLALEQSIIYLKSLLPKEEVKGKEECMLNFNNPDGSVVLAKKKDRDEEFYFMPTKKKGLSKKTKTKSSTIKHNAETFRLFDALKVKAPVTTDQIPETLTSLEDKLTKYNELVAEWKRKLEDGTLLREFKENIGKGKEIVTDEPAFESAAQTA